MRFVRQASRSISGVTLFFFVWLTLQPLQAAAQAAKQTPVAAKAAEIPEEAQYGQALAEMEDLLQDIVPEAMQPPGAKAPPPAPRPGVDVAAKTKRLRTLHGRIKNLEASVEQGFSEVEAHLKERHLPAELLTRHREAVQAFHSRQAEFAQLMQAVERADDTGKANLPAALQDLGRFLAQHPSRKRHTPLDPKKLPFATPNGKVRAPKETKEELQPITHPPKPVQVAATELTAGMLAQADASTLSSTPTPEDLAQTEDVQITQAIRDLAESLHHNPVEIHNWVRNHIEFLPTYGSIQGSDLTLQTKRGNAFDTASLLLALLRASNIPARYAYGTIQLPIDQVMNWVGGVTSPEAALDLLGQGGIPSIGITSGGKIASVRLEHVWVEAYVDYVPSRGAKHRQGDTWVPLDAAFKQYQYTAGMDIQSAVPFDAQNFISQIQQGATINETEGWVQNIDQSKIQQALTDYQTQVKTYIDGQNANATVGDVLGTQKIVLQDPSILMGTLPYQTLAVSSRLQALPDSLKWKYRTEFGDPYGNSLVSLQKSTPVLAGKKITFSFLPASPADLDLINSYLPQPHPDGTPIQPSELPSSLPGYLIHLKAEIRVDGELIQQSGGAPTLGTELVQTAALYNPATGQWEEGAPNRPIAGEYHAIALDLQGTGSTQLTALKTRLEQTKAKLEQFQQNPNDTTPIQNLGKEDLSGDLLYAGILGYFASVDGADQLAARSSKTIVNYRMPSYGAFSATAQPLYWFGIPRNVRFPGVMMDVDYLHTQATAKDADPQKRIAYLRQTGAAGSAFEHAVPEKLFIDPNTCNAPGTPTPDPNKPACAQGVSAVKAIAIAAQQGQKVYTLNQANQSLHAALLSQISIEAEARQEIQYALAAGLEVTVHQSPITVSGWTGSGYIILDKVTGAGAYKISGGANGAWLSEILNFLLYLFTATAGWLESYGKGLISNPVIGGYIQAPFINALISAAERLTIVGFILSVIMIDSNVSLNEFQKIGQIVINFIGFVLTTIAVAAIVDSIVVPAVAAVVAAAAASAIAYAVNLIVAQIAYFVARMRYAGYILKSCVARS